MCAHDRMISAGQWFCSGCGTPLRVPDGVESDPSLGRWNVDPTARHQYRYWDGGSWTEHVVDNGTFSTDSPGKTVPQKDRPSDRWMLRVAASAMTVISALLVIAAFSTLRAIHKSEIPPSPATKSEPMLTPLADMPPQAGVGPSEPVAPSAESLAAIIGATCLPNSSNAVTADGSAAYCERVQGTDTYMWSLLRGDILYPLSGDDRLDTPEGLALAVCMTQTERSESDCATYLQQPSNPGDGRGRG